MPPAGEPERIRDARASVAVHPYLEPLLFVPGPAHVAGPAGLCPGPGLLGRVSLGQPASLHPLRRRRSGGCIAFVRGLRRYYWVVRLPTLIHLRYPPLSGFPLRTQRPSRWAKRRISRFPHKVLGRMHRVSDRAGSCRHSRCRASRCCLPLIATGSAPRSVSILSRLNT